MQCCPAEEELAYAHQLLDQFQIPRVLEGDTVTLRLRMRWAITRAQIGDLHIPTGEERLNAAGCGGRMPSVTSIASDIVAQCPDEIEV